MSDGGYCSAVEFVQGGVDYCGQPMPCNAHPSATPEPPAQPAPALSPEVADARADAAHWRAALERADAVNRTSLSDRARLAAALEAAEQVSIGAWQERLGEWTDTRFPDDTIKDRGLILGEECGEVLRCIVKGDQDIRGGAEHWQAELRSEAVDVFFSLCALAHRAGFELQEVIAARWAEVDAKRFPRGRAALYGAGEPGDEIDSSSVNAGAPGG